MVQSDDHKCSGCDRFACGPNHHRCCRGCPFDHTRACEARQNMVPWLRHMIPELVELDKAWHEPDQEPRAEQAPEAEDNLEEDLAWWWQGRTMLCTYCDRIACGPWHYDCCRFCRTGHSNDCRVRHFFLHWYVFRDFATVIFRAWLDLFSCLLAFSIFHLDDQ